ncbi:MAG: restriction endonuclease subunit S [Bacteroidota bacterium]
MNYKYFVQKLGFTPKENTSGIYFKRYDLDYSLEVDFEKSLFYFGGKIQSQGKNYQNITKPEDWVVLECLNRLLEKGYSPENIQLEKVYPSGHGHSGRLDICVNHVDGSEYLLIECKTYGKEFNTAVTRLRKDGGQLFTYFKFGNKANVIMLYASELKVDEVVYRNEIVKIEDEYRTGDVKDFYEKWNKLTKDNGIFEEWVKKYHYVSKALTHGILVAIKQEDSSLIFNQFLEILRHNIVSDKPNAFNKIFTLFLCKIYDEKTKEGTDDELDFQWKEGVDDDISFQLRLADLYKKGMKDFLEKEVTDFSDADFDSKYNLLDDNTKQKLKMDIAKLRLEKNNEFAIKEVYDKKSFTENTRVVKEVVELLQRYKIRYTKKQQYLSDFFEMLLTTGLKQESGQFFTPVPIAQFILKSIPIDKMVVSKLAVGKRDDLLPFIIDYAAGSGHFITESMHEIQRLLTSLDTNHLKSEAKKFVEISRISHFDWALQYVYGIEKDYRLVKVGKVGCYLHGDGLANVIHSDGLAHFNHVDYKGNLKKTDKDFPQENKQFEIVVSNPPYSVSSFKNASSDYYKEKDFELWPKLTDNSSEIECLFIERTKQLLKDGGVAGIILPISILSNSGIYTKSREIILQYFDIVAIAELGSNTFMATGTNTVTLFLRRKNNYEIINLKTSVNKFFSDLQDVTLNGIEKPVAKYVSHVWKTLSYEDYVSLLRKRPNKAIEAHEIYQDYRKKIFAKSENVFWQVLLAKENEKLCYFVIVFPQKLVIVKSGNKDAEKRFLGYGFSKRRGSEGIHPMQRGKHIEDCTQLFDPNVFDNPEKASTYIYKAFNGDFDFPINDSLQNNVYRYNLVDMLTFDRMEFEKSISLSIGEKVKIESKWDLVRIGELVENMDNKRIPLTQRDRKKGEYPYYGATGIIDYVADYIFAEKLVLIGEDGAKWGANENSAFIVNGKYWVNNHAHVLRPNRNLILDEYLIEILNTLDLSDYVTGLNVPKLNQGNLNQILIPLPPIDIQQQIVAEMEEIEERAKTFVINNIDELRGQIFKKYL